MIFPDHLSRYFLLREGQCLKNPPSLIFFPPVSSPKENLKVKELANISSTEEKNDLKQYLAVVAR